MALLGELSLEGLVVNGAYWKIGELYWNANNPGFLSFRIDGYASTETYQEGRGAIASQVIEIEMPLDNLEDPRTNLFNQVRTLAYEIIKTLPAYEGALDA